MAASKSLGRTGEEVVSEVVVGEVEDLVDIGRNIIPRPLSVHIADTGCNSLLFPQYV